MSQAVDFIELDVYYAKSGADDYIRFTLACGDENVMGRDSVYFDMHDLKDAVWLRHQLDVAIAEYEKAGK